MSARRIIGIDVAPIGRARLTGTERYALEIVTALLALPQASEVEWRLYQRDGQAQARIVAAAPQSATAPNVAFVTLGGGRLWTHRRLGREAAQRPPSVLFVPAHVLPVALPGRTLPPAVVTLHDVGFQTVAEGHTRRQRAYLAWSTRDALRRAAAIIVPSRATAADLEQHFGAPPGKLHVVHEAAAPPPPADAAAEARVRTRLNLRRPYALFVGSIQPRKNLVRLAQAYARLHAAGLADFDLVLAGGDGWKAQPIHAAIAALGLPQQIHLPGYLPEPERAALLQGARLFCYPSLAEGFGLPLLEAHHVGVPVMTSNNSSLPEVAGEGALLVDPTDVDALAQAMLRLSRDEALRARLIAAGHENIKRFSWQKAAAETYSVLEAATGYVRLR